MKFRYRFAYFLIGFMMGLFVVLAFFNAKKTDYNYFPNARVLKDLRSKPFIYSEEASKAFAQKWLDTIDVKNTLQFGDVDFELSNIPNKNGKLYIIYGKTTKKENITLKVINYPNKVILAEIIKI